MSFASVFEEVAARRRSLVVYSATEDDLAAVAPFATRNVTVEFRRLPASSDPFVVVRDGDGGFVGSTSLDTLEHLTRPEVTPPWGVADEDAAHRAFRELLDTTLFASFDRQQLLATVREFEERAWRVGEGRLHVGFQSGRALARQVPVYRRLAGETDLDVHLYVQPGEAPRAIPDATLHVETAAEIGAYWFFVFVPADPDTRQHCALLAEERAPGDFYGFWTYERRLVDELLGYLESTYGSP